VSGTRSLPADGSIQVETRTAQGQLIERFDTDVGHGFGQFVYNVGGAAPLVEWTAAYGNASQRSERRLGATRWISSSADVLFGEPPRSISTKGGGGTRDVLSGAGNEPPGRQLSLLAGVVEQQRVAALHARWDALDSRYAGQWLAAVQASPELKKILADRMAESPDDVLLLRLEQDSAADGEHAAVCERHRARAAAAPQNVNLQYIAARCLPDGPDQDRAFVGGHAQYPKHGWFAYAAAYVEAGASHWQQALEAYELARRMSPPLADTVALDMARIHRLLHHRDAEIAALRKTSDTLDHLLALESGQGIDAPAYKAYSELEHGDVDRAVQLSNAQPTQQARLLRLAAASDGANAALVTQALALPSSQGLDDGTVWASLALAARAGQDLSVFQPAARRATAQQFGAMLGFVDALKNGRSPAEAERLLDGLPPELRGHGYSIGSILLGAKAPAAWRDAARRLLFASERPFFN